MANIRLSKLAKELKDLPVESVTSGRGAIQHAEVEPGVYEDVIIDYAPEATAQDEIDAEAIKAAHDPTDYEAIVKAGADAQAANIPGWASWTEQETLDWIEANVTDLASAKQALKAMSRMIVALRNKTWPELQE